MSQPGIEPVTPGSPYKGNISIKPSKSFFNNHNNNKIDSPPPLKQSTRNVSLGYIEIEKKEEGAGARSFLCDF